MVLVPLLYFIHHVSTNTYTDVDTVGYVGLPMNSYFIYPLGMVFHLRGHILEEVDSFKHLGSICSTDMSMQPEIANRLSRASGASHKLKRLKVWGDKDISQGIKMVLQKVICSVHSAIWV